MHPSQCCIDDDDLIMMMIEMKVMMTNAAAQSHTMQKGLGGEGQVMSRLEICQKIYTTEDFRVKNLHRKRVIFDIC